MGGNDCFQWRKVQGVEIHFWMNEKVACSKIRLVIFEWARREKQGGTRKVVGGL